MANRREDGPTRDLNILLEALGIHGDDLSMEDLGYEKVHSRTADFRIQITCKDPVLKAMLESVITEAVEKLDRDYKL